MARKSAVDLVLSQMIPVDPDGSQPTYIRSKRSIQTSEDLIAFQTCMSDELSGNSYDDRAAARDAFESAASSCS
jgi:hypothetical protein